MDIPENGQSSPLSEEYDLVVSTGNMDISDLSSSKDSSITESGCENNHHLTETPKVAKNELVKSVIEVVERYFLDENLLKNRFLLQIVRRTKNGYVSLKLISRMRKVKSITSDWKEVADSLKNSELLELNEQCTKVRRKTPLPIQDVRQNGHYQRRPRKNSAFTSKAIVITGPITFAVAYELVRNFGRLVKIELIRPNEAYLFAKQNETFKKFMSDRPEVSSSTSAFIEFSSRKSVNRACSALSGIGNFAVYSLAPAELSSE